MELKLVKFNDSLDSYRSISFLEINAFVKQFVDDETFWSTIQHWCSWSSWIRCTFRGFNRHARQHYIKCVLSAAALKQKVIPFSFHDLENIAMYDIQDSTQFFVYLFRYLLTQHLVTSDELFRLLTTFFEGARISTFQSVLYVHLKVHFDIVRPSLESKGDLVLQLFRVLFEDGIQHNIRKTLYDLHHFIVAPNGRHHPKLEPRCRYEKEYLYNLYEIQRLLKEQERKLINNLKLQWTNKAEQFPLVERLILDYVDS